MGEMHETSDAQLLRQYAEHGDEAAFREIVVRHTDLVYCSALRQVGSPDLAGDVAQSVFTDLARSAPKLAASGQAHASLLGWLYRSTRYAALNQLRDERRRQARERQLMEQLAPAAEAAPDWERVRPVLDEAMAELSDDDREALLLRFFKDQDFRAVGHSLGVSDDTAQKRVSRALERLHAAFTRRGVTTSTGALAAALPAHAVTLAPAGLAAALSAAALSGTSVAAAATTTATITATKAIVMTTLQKTLITTALVAAAGTAVYEARQASRLQNQVQALQQEQAPLTEQLRKLETDNERLSNQVAQTKDSQALSQAQLNDLLKLRAKATQVQTDSRELARMKSTLAQQKPALDLVNNAMAAGAAAGEKAMQKDALARLSRMKKMLNLTDDQEQAISHIMTNRIHLQAQLGLGMLTGKLTPEQTQAEAAASADSDAEIKALLTPEQLAAYPEYQQAEQATAADASATSEARRLVNQFSLPKDQQEQLRALLYEMKLKEPAGTLNEAAVTQAKRSGNLAEAAKLDIALQKARLEEKLKILDGILSPEQMTTYRQEQTDRIDQQADRLKMFLQQKSADATN